MLQKLSTMPKEFNEEDSDTIPYVDIGANVGSFAIPIAGWGYRLHAFEIMPKNNRLLESSIRENTKSHNWTEDRFRLHKVGLDYQHRWCFVAATRDNTQNGYTICEDTRERMEQRKKTLGVSQPSPLVRHLYVDELILLLTN